MHLVTQFIPKLRGGGQGFVQATRGLSPTSANHVSTDLALCTEGIVMSEQVWVL